MSEPVLADGPAAPDAIIATYAGKLAKTWPGNEALVGHAAEVEAIGQTSGVSIAVRSHVSREGCS